MKEREKLNILIVDDKPENLVSLEAVLESPDLHIIKATSGSEALSLMFEHDFALVLLDVQMPEMNGFETAALMRKSEKTKYIPIIFVSAISKEHNHIFKGYESGAVDYLLKPLDQDILKGKVNVFLELHRQKKSLKKATDELNQTVEELAEVNKSLQHEITERKQTGEELKKTKDHLNNIIESSLDGIIVGDSTGNIVKVNESFLKLIGYRNEEIIGKHIMELSITEKGTYESTTGDKVEIDEEFFSDTKKMTYEKLFKEGTIINWETYYLCKDRKIVPVEMNIAYLYNEEGDVIGSVGINRDITERRKAEMRIKESRDYLANIFKTSADGIMLTNNKGKITMVNEAAEKILGYSRSELVGRHSGDLTPEGEIYKKEEKEFIAKLFEDGVVIGFERTWLKKDRSLVTIELSAALLKDGDGNRTGSVASIRDITERKEMEHKLIQSEKLKSLGELAGGVAHDFNNVLAAILGRAQLLKMMFEPPPGKEERRRSMLELNEGLEVIEKAARDGAETVRRIQEFARRRDDDKYFTTVDLNEIVDNTLDFTRMKWKNDAESKGIKFNIQKEFSTLPPTSGSAAELREVLTNLINNAVDAMPQGGDIKIKTFKEDSHIVINVEDTGVGIPRALRERIFDPFFTTKGAQSTGLGMSVSYGIISRHHGSISVDSIEGEGTTFTIKLPIAEKIVKEEKEKPISDKQKKARILVIEDEEKVCELLSSILTTGGHEVEMASDGNQGMKMYKEKEFDLVFTDLGMPGMSGWQVAEKVKGINGRVPVVLITGWDIRQEESEMKDSYVDLIVHKPFEMDQVLNVVQEGMILRDRFRSV